MNLYEVTYLNREGSRAKCVVEANDHNEAIAIARISHDDICSAKRLSDAESEQERRRQQRHAKTDRKTVDGTLVVSLLIGAVIVGFFALLIFCRVSRS